MGTAVFVVQDSAARVREGMLQGLRVPYPVLVDESRTSYEAWGLGRLSPLAALHPRVWLRYARRRRQEGRRLAPGSTPLQLGGDFVVGPDGRLGCSHPQRGIDDRPAAEDLVRELERAAG